MCVHAPSSDLADAFRLHGLLASVLAAAALSQLRLVLLTIGGAVTRVCRDGHLVDERAPAGALVLG